MYMYKQSCYLTESCCLISTKINTCSVLKTQPSAMDRGSITRCRFTKSYPLILGVPCQCFYLSPKK